MYADDGLRTRGMAGADGVNWRCGSAWDGELVGSEGTTGRGSGRKLAVGVSWKCVEEGSEAVLSVMSIGTAANVGAFTGSEGFAWFGGIGGIGGRF